MANEAHDTGREAAEAVNRAASVLMKRGIALLNENSRASLAEAVTLFERAIEMRKDLPLELDPLFRYGLAAGHMNRGDALTRLGSSEQLAEAVRVYDAALEVLNFLRLEENPLFARRVAIAWGNRGLTLQAMKSETAILEAEKSLDRAIGILRDAEGIEDRSYLLAVGKVNLGNLLAGLKSRAAAERARSLANEALGIVSRTEMEDAVMAEVGLKARHVLCRAVAVLLAEDERTAAREGYLVEATDAVDGGMALARKWGARFDGLARELFRFGAGVYHLFQPHFLNEFLLENLDPTRSSNAFAKDAEMHAAAWESLWRTLRELQKRGFKAMNTPEFEGLLAQLRELRMADERLEELRVASATAKVKKVE